jgi:hypothetical protein
MINKRTNKEAQLQAEVSRLNKDLIVANDIISTLRSSNEFYKSEYEKLKSGNDPVSQNLNTTMHLVKILQDQNSWMQRKLSEQCSGELSRISPELNAKLDRAAAKLVEEGRSGYQVNPFPGAHRKSHTRTKKINLICIDPGDNTGLEHLERYTSPGSQISADGDLCYVINELNGKLKKACRFHIVKCKCKKSN